jgi:hypothetical protein
LKMHITVTIKMEATSQGELIDTFGAQVKVCREHFDRLKEEGVFGVPAEVDIRYLVIGGGWREPAPEHGVPQVEV